MLEALAAAGLAGEAGRGAAEQAVPVVVEEGSAAAEQAGSAGEALEAAAPVEADALEGFLSVI